MKVTIPIYYDYSSTLCYIAWCIVRELERELEFKPLWKGVPIQLRNPRVQPGRKLSDAERAKILMVSAETGVPVVPPERWVDSRLALEGAEIARELGVFDSYHTAVFRAVCEEGRDISRLEVLDEIVSQLEVDKKNFLAELTSGRMAQRLRDNKAEAERFSAVGYPSFVLGSFTLVGIQHIDTMRLLFRRFIELKSETELGN